MLKSAIITKSIWNILITHDIFNLLWSFKKNDLGNYTSMHETILDVKIQTSGKNILN